MIASAPTAGCTYIGFALAYCGSARKSFSGMAGSAIDNFLSNATGNNSFAIATIFRKACNSFFLFSSFIFMF